MGRRVAERSAEDGCFTTSILPHLDAAHSYARYLTRDADAAEDIVQEACLRAVRGFGSWRGGPARAWLLAIVRNCFLASLAGGRPVAEPIDELGSADPLVEQHTPESITAAKLEVDRLRSIIDGLPQPFREVLVLRELEELSYKEIAQVTGAPIGTVMSRLARARHMIAGSLLAATAATGSRT